MNPSSFGNQSAKHEWKKLSLSEDWILYQSQNINFSVIYIFFGFRICSQILTIVCDTQHMTNHNWLIFSVYIWKLILLIFLCEKKNIYEILDKSLYICISQQKINYNIIYWLWFLKSASVLGFLVISTDTRAIHKNRSYQSFK